jgi:hypothetical protein
MVSHRIRFAAAFLATVACSGGERETDPRLQELTAGIPRDSALRILTQGATSGDSLANIYRREMYLLDGKAVEILFYSRDGLKEGQGAAAAESTLRPVIVTEGMVSGWGWAYFDSLARIHDIRARVR